MLADEVRATAYLRAIERAVGPGDVVVEIGTGLGYFAVAACRAGARRVFAIETSPLIALAEQVARANACADRVTFVHGDSRDIALPERGDVLLADLRGVLPLHGDHIATIADARSRHLREGATIVGAGDTLWASPCAAPEKWRAHHASLGDAPHGIDRRVVAARMRESWYRDVVRPDDLLAPAVQWGAIDYTTATDPDVTGRAEWTMDRDGDVEGLALWFDADLGFGAGFSNRPGRAHGIYGTAFFPFPRSLPVLAGDRLSTSIRAKHIHGDYVWGWDSSHEPRAGTGRGSTRFRQSNLSSLPVTPDQLRDLGEDDRRAEAQVAAAPHREDLVPFPTTRSTD